MAELLPITFTSKTMTIRATGKVVGLGNPFVYEGKFVTFAGQVLRGASTLELEIGSPLEVLVHDLDFQDWIKRSWAGDFASFTEQVIGSDVALVYSITSPDAGYIGSTRPLAAGPYFGVPPSRFSNATVAAASAAVPAALPVASSFAAAPPNASATALPNDSSPADLAASFPNSFRNMGHRPREIKDDDDEDYSPSLERRGASNPFTLHPTPAGWGGHGRTTSMPTSLPYGFMAPTRTPYAAVESTYDDDDTFMPPPNRAKSNSTMGGMTLYSGSEGSRRRRHYHMNEGYAPTSPSPSTFGPREEAHAPPREEARGRPRDDYEMDSQASCNDADFRDSLQYAMDAIRQAGDNAMYT